MIWWFDNLKIGRFENLRIRWFEDVVFRNRSFFNWNFMQEEEFGDLMIWKFDDVLIWRFEN